MRNQKDLYYSTHTDHPVLVEAASAHSAIMQSIVDICPDHSATNMGMQNQSIYGFKSVEFCHTLSSFYTTILHSIYEF